jgi:hypothetical protein
LIIFEIYKLIIWQKRKKWHTAGRRKQGKNKDIEPARAKTPSRKTKPIAKPLLFLCDLAPWRDIAFSQDLKPLAQRRKDAKQKKTKPLTFLVFLRALAQYCFQPKPKTTRAKTQRRQAEKSEAYR